MKPTLFGLTLLVILGITLQVSAAEIQQESRLRRLSMKFTSMPPSDDDELGLQQAISNGTTDAFFKAKAIQYTKTAEFVNQMQSQVEINFGLKPTFGAGVSTFDKIVRRVFEKNKNYSEILTTTRTSDLDATLKDKEFYATLFYVPSSYIPSSSSTDSMVGFIHFNNSASAPPVSSIHTELVHDPRISGIVTTSRFYNRYYNTSTNMNLKRAAAMFRTLLCDSMTPSVEVLAGDKEDELVTQLVQIAAQTARERSAKGAPVKTIGEIAHDLSVNSRHASDPACLKCHYKLEPMASTFSANGNILASEPTPGGLVFTSPITRKLVSIPVNNAAELMKSIAVQDDFADCQVEKFWKYMMGGQTPIPEEERPALRARFKKTNSKTNGINDFLVYLSGRSEFRELHLSPNSENRISLAQVQPILKKCDSCHTGSYVPAFSRLPIGGSGALTENWLDSIRYVLKLKKGDEFFMPPVKSGAEIPQAEKDLVVSWIEQGAFDGKSTYYMSREARPPENTWSSVQPYLKRCDSCHNAREQEMGYPIPRFATLNLANPDTKAKKNNLEILKLMARRMDMHEGQMPAHRVVWSSELLTRIRSVIGSEIDKLQKQENEK
jgi:hypothetical protein